MAELQKAKISRRTAKASLTRAGKALRSIVESELSHHLFPSFIGLPLADALTMARETACQTMVKLGMLKMSCDTLPR